MSFNFSPRIIRDGLVLYLDAANSSSYISGSTAWNDISRNNNNGTLINGPTFNSNNSGSIVFDGVNDYAIHNSLNLGTVCSWGLWVNYNSLSGTQVLLGSNIANYYSLFYNGLTFYVNYAGSVGSLSYPTGLSANTWYNIFLTRNGSTITVYLNGNSIGTMSGGSPTLATIFSIIGAERTTVYFSNVKISNVLLYNRTLSASEVLQNYNVIKSRFGL